MARISHNLEIQSAPFDKKDFLTLIYAGKLPSATTCQLQLAPTNMQSELKEETLTKEYHASPSTIREIKRKIIVRNLSYVDMRT